MVTRTTRVEIDSVEDWRTLVEEAGANGGCVLTRDGEPVARISPVRPRRSSRHWQPSEADIKAFESAAGGWAGIVDVEQFHKDNAESRRISSRPPVKL